MKINSRVHGIIDYLMVIFLWLSPSIFSLPGKTTVFIYGLGMVHLVLSMLTHYEYGLVRFILLRIHGYTELIISLLLVPIAFYLGNIEGEFTRNFLLIFAVSVFVFWILSDYTDKPAGTREVPFIESNTDGGMI